MIKSRLHGPLPAGCEAAEDMLDFRAPVAAKISGPVGGSVVDGMVAVPVRLEALACPAFLALPKGKDIPIGETVNVVITEANTDLSIIRVSLA